MSDDAYAGVAERYDRFFPVFGEHRPEVVAFYRRLFSERGVRSVLDCACGTGHHLALLHSLGCEVIGSDLSGAMLERARLNLTGRGIEPVLHQLDFRELPQHFRRRFDAVVCLSTSLPQVSNESEILRALTSMCGVLREGGLLIITQGTTDRQWREQTRFFLAVQQKDFSRLIVVDYLGRGARYHLLDLTPQGLETWSIDYPVVPLRDDYQRLLWAAGFERASFYGDYGFEPYSKENSQHLIIVAEA